MLSFLSSMGRSYHITVISALLWAACARHPAPEPKPQAQAQVSGGSDSAASPSAAAPARQEASAAPPVSTSPNDGFGMALFRNKPLAGCIYEHARDFAARYCSACHSSQATNRVSKSASKAFLLDTYAEWLSEAAQIPRRLDRDSLKGKIMPPLTFPQQPSDAERRLIVDWVKRGSPNTPDGR
jgi:hypothetical protein